MEADVIKGVFGSVMLTVGLLTSCVSVTSGVKGEPEVPTSVVVIFGDKTATIIEEKYVNHHTEGGLVTLEFPDGSKIKTTSDMLVFSEFKDYEEVEELVRDIIGKDGEINYYSRGNSLTRSR